MGHPSDGRRGSVIMYYSSQLDGWTLRSEIIWGRGSVIMYYSSQPS